MGGRELIARSWREGPVGRLAAALAVLVLIASCGSTKSASTPTTTVAPRTSSTSATATTNPAGGSIEGPDPSELPTQSPATRPPSLPNPSTASGRQQFVTAVFNDAQSMWSTAFRQSGITYKPATLRIFTSVVGTACGEQASDVGPFYCPGDLTVNVDLRFFTALYQQTGAGGDFAEAYIVAHELGHHVQNLLGIFARVAAADHRDPAGANALSVRVELQADCFAGVWAHTAYTSSLLRPSEFQQALNAAAVVGDDFLHQMSGKQVEPDNFTHGTSAQRQHWLTVGFESGSPSSCDTFSGNV